jgi:hypothetical protein
MGGKHRETLRGEGPVRTGVSRVVPGQRIGLSRAHNPKVAGSNPAPATKRTLGTPTYPEGFLAFGIVEVASIPRPYREPANSCRFGTLLLDVHRGSDRH